MATKLHPKVEELKRKVGSSPFHMSHQSAEAFEAVRSMKAIEDDSRLVKMYHAIFGEKDDYGTIPLKGCFKKSIEDRGPGSNATCKILVLWQHDQKDPIGLPKVLKEDKIGLYAEYEPDDVPSGNRTVTQVRSGTINQGSYGFNYIWDKMEYDDKLDAVIMKECNLWEISPVSIGSQRGTFAVRNAAGQLVDEYLDDETEDFLKQIPRKFHLELRSLIARHISLAENKPLETRTTALEDLVKPKQGRIDYKELAKHFKL